MGQKLCPSFRLTICVVHIETSTKLTMILITAHIYVFIFSNKQATTFGFFIFSLHQVYFYEIEELESRDIKKYRYFLLIIFLARVILEIV